MSLQKQIYSVLVVSSAENFNSALLTLLPESKYQPVQVVSNVGTAKRLVAERAFDFVFINSPLPDESGTRFAIDLCATRGTVVVLFVKNDIYTGVYDKVAEHGVFTLPKPTARVTIQQALHWMASSRERLRKSEKKAVSIEEKMEEIRQVNRAKWLLISELKMSETEAHRFIEKQAMDCCISKKVVAENIIKTYT